MMLVTKELLRALTCTSILYNFVCPFAGPAPTCWL